MTLDDLPKLPPPDPNLPDFVIEEILSTQKVNDYIYIASVNHYNDMAAQFVTTQQMVRGSNRNYVVPPFAVPMPTRNVVTANNEGTVTITRAPEYSLRLTPPSVPDLPPVTTLPTGGPFGPTGNPIPTDDTLALVKRNNQILEALAKSLGLQS